MALDPMQARTTEALGLSCSNHTGCTHMCGRGTCTAIGKNQSREKGLPNASLKLLRVVHISQAMSPSQKIWCNGLAVVVKTAKFDKTIYTIKTK